MRTNKKLITTLAVFVLVLMTSIFCMTVFAEKTQEDETLTAAVTPAVSGCDLKKDDLHMAKVKLTNFSMLVPKGELLTVESSSKDYENSKLMEMGYNRSSLINSNIFLYYNSNYTNECTVYGVIVQLNPLDAYYSDYAKLTKEQQDELIAQRIASTGNTSAKGSFEKINGITYMFIKDSNQDGENKYVDYELSTVIDKYKYVVQINATNPDQNDRDVLNEMINSIKIGGMKEPLSALNIALVVCVAILLVAVAFAFFTLYRFDSFVKSGATNVRMFGFDLPEPAASEDDSDDSDDNGENDGFEDEAADETVAPASDEKIIDDESDSE